MGVSLPLLLLFLGLLPPKIDRFKNIQIEKSHLERLNVKNVR